MSPGVFDGHTRVGLSFSGGKDSLVMLDLMRPYWDRLTVYWCNPGNPLPETVELMEKVRAMVPNFKEVPGRQPEVIEQNGWPSDLVPDKYTREGNAIFGPTPFKIQSRLSCCYWSLMQPVYQAMLDDGVTLCFRGKRHDEEDKTGFMSGDVTDEGMQLAFPIYEWTEQDIANYVKNHGIELPAYYEHSKTSLDCLDCLDCTAWWGEGLPKYLQAKRPEHYQEYKRRMILIKSAITEQLNQCEV